MQWGKKIQRSDLRVYRYRRIVNCASGGYGGVPAFA